MSAAEDMPSLSSLRRPMRRAANRERLPAERAPSLFDLLPPEIAEPPAAKPVARPASPPGPPAIPAETRIPTEARIWTVADLVHEVRSLVERSYTHITIDGEISNWRPAASGHCYFTLKDGNAQLSVVLFRRQAQLLRFKPKDGDAVRLRGQVSVYESRGQMQLIAESMEEVGQGALLAAVQRLKERLRREGLFDRKRPLPAFPRCIGIVTSLQGAALRDIVKVCRRRHAAVNLLIYPAAVQGPQCAPEIIAGILWFSAHPERADVVLVARGGGSWEDLHGFDAEGIARAIAACPVPVVTGIGHATDSTIADAAADLCAPTPSAAAELLTAAQHRVEERLDRLRARVLRAGRFELLRARQRLAHLSAEAALQRLRNALARREQRLDELSFRAEAAIARTLRDHAERLSRMTTRLRRQDLALRVAQGNRRHERLSDRLNAAGHALTANRLQYLITVTSRLDALSPLRVLDRGYALVYGPNSKLLRSTTDVESGENVTVRLSKGTLRASVTGKNASVPGRD